MTTVGDIRRWLEEAAARGAIHMIVVCDTFSREDYPVFVMPTEDFWERYQSLDGVEMQEIHEVYDLSLDLEAQLDEFRAYHPPVKESQPGS